MYTPLRKRPTNVSLDPELVKEARDYDINVSLACERGLLEEVLRIRRERWKEENRAAMESCNDWVEKNGLPLARYRMF